MTIQKRLKIRHANILNHARDNLTKDQRRVLYMCLWQTQENDWPEHGLFKLSAEDYANWFQVSYHEARRDLRSAINGFKGQSVTIYDVIDDEDVEIDADWASTRIKTINPEKGYCWIQINEYLKKYLMPVAFDIPFTISMAGDLGLIKLKYSQRLYAALAQFRATGQYQTSSRLLFERWSLPESYNKWSLMKMRVIDPAVEELRRISVFKDLSYTQVQTNSTVSILFQFTPSPE